MKNVKDAERITAEENKKAAPKHAAEKPKKNFKVAVICIVCVLVAVIVGISAYANMYKGIFPNTYVAETKVSNMSSDRLLTYLNDTYSDSKLSGKSIALSCNNQSETLSIDELDASFDNTALRDTVLKSGKDGNFITNTINFVKRFVKAEVIDPVIVYDEQVMASVLDKVTEGLETEPVGHTFDIGDNKVTVKGPSNGVKVVREKAIDSIKKQITSMTFSPLTLQLEDVSPAPFNFDEFYNRLIADAENAYYEKIDGKVQVHPSKAKVEVDKGTVKSAINSLKNSESNTAEFAAVTTEPEKTAKHLTETLYSEVLGTYNTNFGGSSAARANNVKLAATRINGTELMPGEEFSYDKTIMPRTYENGYLAAPVFVGNKVESGLGGGICQPSSTLYVAALYANLQILERHPHSMPVSYLPGGLDATIAEGVLDLRFKNTTDYPIKITATSDNGVVKFDILGYNPDKIKVELDRGPSYQVIRVVYKDGKEIKREEMKEVSYSSPEKASSNEASQNSSSASDTSTTTDSTPSGSTTSSSTPSSSATSSSTSSSSTSSSSASSSSTPSSSTSSSSTSSSSTPSSSTSSSSTPSSSTPSGSASSSSAPSSSTPSSSAPSSSTPSSSAPSSSTPSSSAPSSSAPSSSTPSSSAPAAPDLVN